jgi:hypothetical protein
MMTAKCGSALRNYPDNSRLPCFEFAILLAAVNCARLRKTAAMATFAVASNDWKLRKMAAHVW